LSSIKPIVSMIIFLCPCWECCRCLSSHQVSYGVCMHVTVCGELGFLVSDLSHTIRLCVPFPHHRHPSLLFPNPPPRENLMVVGLDHQ
jgi:hypothetical protein